jgi:hypothetical protein
MLMRLRGHRRHSRGRTTSPPSAAGHHCERSQAEAQLTLAGKLAIGLSPAALLLFRWCVPPPPLELIFSRPARLVAPHCLQACSAFDEPPWRSLNRCLHPVLEAALSLQVGVECTGRESTRPCASVRRGTSPALPAASGHTNAYGRYR